MEVRAIKAHANGFGATFAKAIGDIYTLPDEYGQMLILAGLVEETAPSVTSPPKDMVAVTPSDVTVFPRVTRGIYVGFGGDIVIRTADGDDLTFTFAENGTVLPIAAVMVKATGTTADNIIAMF